MELYAAVWADTDCHTVPGEEPLFLLSVRNVPTQQGVYSERWGPPQNGLHLPCRYALDCSTNALRDIPRPADNDSPSPALRMCPYVSGDASGPSQARAESRRQRRGSDATFYTLPCLMKQGVPTWQSKPVGMTSLRLRFAVTGQAQERATVALSSTHKVPFVLLLQVMKHIVWDYPLTL